MLRRYQRFFVSLQVLRDAVLVGLSFAAAYACRFALPLPGAVRPPFAAEPPPPAQTLLVGGLLVLAWLGAAAATGLYTSRRVTGPRRDALDVARTTAIAFTALVTATYFLLEVRYSRGVLLWWAAWTTATLAAARLTIKWALGRLRAAGYNLRHVAVIGAGAHADAVVAALTARASLGLHIVGRVALPAPGEPPHVAAAVAAGPALAALPRLGTVAELPRIVAAFGIEQVLVALPLDALPALGPIMALLSRETVDVRLVPDYGAYVTLCGGVESVAGFSVVSLQAAPLAGWSALAKRLFDLVGGGVATVVSLPLLALLALAVRLSSPGPVLFVQERVGLDGRPFPMLKFRTMRVDAEPDGARMARADDPRCTRLGAWMRRLSLDELPQLFNVLAGDMSLVGPRPERPAFIRGFREEMPRYALRHKIKAGMTGWAQVHGLRGNTSMSRRLELDLYYMEHWSLWLDLKILARTVFGGFLSPHAY